MTIIFRSAPCEVGNKAAQSNDLLCHIRRCRNCPFRSKKEVDRNCRAFPELLSGLTAAHSGGSR